MRLKAIGMTFVLLVCCSSGAAVLSRAVVNHLDALVPIGPLGLSTPITVGVVLARPNPAGEEALVEALYDPNSAQYQQSSTRMSSPLPSASRPASSSRR